MKSKLLKFLSIAAIIGCSFLFAKEEASATAPKCSSGAAAALKSCTLSTATCGKCFYNNSFTGASTGCDLTLTDKAANSCGGWSKVFQNNPNFKSGFCSRTDLCDGAPDVAAACGITCASDEPAADVPTSCDDCKNNAATFCTTQDNKNTCKTLCKSVKGGMGSACANQAVS